MLFLALQPPLPRDDIPPSTSGRTQRLRAHSPARKFIGLLRTLPKYLLVFRFKFSGPQPCDRLPGSHSLIPAKTP